MSGEISQRVQRIAHARTLNEAKRLAQEIMDFWLENGPHLIIMNEQEFTALQQMVNKAVATSPLHRDIVLWCRLKEEWGVAAGEMEVE